MQLIATRIYHDFDLKTGEEYELRDRMFRKTCDSFVWVRAGVTPSDAPIEQTCSLEEVFDWLQDCPKEIARLVITGGRQGDGQSVKSECLEQTSEQRR
jgi:hypothetical protein